MTMLLTITSHIITSFNASKKAGYIHMIIIILIVSLIMLSSCTQHNSTIQYSQESVPENETHPAAVMPTDMLPQKSSVTVIIDPGHGFDDPGSTPSALGCHESEITLRAARLVVHKLSQMGITAVLTHNGESFPSCNSLCSAAERFGVDYDPSKMVDNNIFSAYERSVYENILAKQLGNCFFVSLHSNSFPDDSSVSGMSVDYYEGNPQADKLGSFCRLFKDVMNENMGKAVTIFKDNHEMAYIVTKYTEVPSVLIEMGYGTNKQDAADLRSAEWLENFAEGLSKCIRAYINDEI